MIPVPGRLAVELAVWFSGMVAAVVTVWLPELMWVGPLAIDIFSPSS